MLDKLSILFPSSWDNNLANDVFNALTSETIMLRAALDNAINQKRPVVEQYDARILACDAVLYHLGLEHVLRARIMNVRKNYESELIQEKSKLCFKLKKLLGFA